jgi:hypothetical protein
VPTAETEHIEEPLTEKQKQFYITRHVVMALQIDGFFGGQVNRVSIGGQLLRQGDAIDQESGVIVRQIDLGKRSVTFVDSMGNVIVRQLE